MQEAKSKDYLDVINKNALSQEHMSLLISGKQVGQTDTAKQAIQKLYVNMWMCEYVGDMWIS